MCFTGPIHWQLLCAPRLAHESPRVKASARLRWALTAFLFAVTALPTMAQNPETPKQASPKEQAEAAEATDLPEYPDSQQGLEELIGEMLSLDQAGDKKSLAVYAKSLDAQDAESWFASAFGSDLGTKLSEATAANRRKTDSEARAMIATMRKENLTAVRAAKFTDSCNAEATAEEYPVLRLRQNQMPLYDVRFHDANREAVWGFFAYTDGGFRYLGTPQENSLEEALKDGAGGQGEPLEVSRDVQAAKLISHVEPVLPSVASVHGAETNVVLHALIGTDGSVRQLELLKGMCGLSEAAMDAVKHWRYEPTLLNGNSVEVSTTIDVDFAPRIHQ